MKIHTVKDFLIRWFLGTMLSVAGALSAWYIGGGGEYSFRELKNFTIFPIHQPGAFFVTITVTGFLVGLGLPRD